LVVHSVSSSAEDPLSTAHHELCTNGGDGVGPLE
jgi:hypothetical protein